MDQIYFLALVVGVPSGLAVLAVLVAHIHPRGDAEILDWKLTRSPEREAELQTSDVAQMLAAQNRYRRRRGAPEHTLEEVTERAWALHLPRPDCEQGE